MKPTEKAPDPNFWTPPRRRFTADLLAKILCIFLATLIASKLLMAVHWSIAILVIAVMVGLVSISVWGYIAAFSDSVKEAKNG